MKNQNKYAQLVEAQSPEPQELVDEQSNKCNVKDISTSEKNLNSLSDKNEANLSIETKAMTHSIDLNLECSNDGGKLLACFSKSGIKNDIKLIGKNGALAVETNDKINSNNKDAVIIVNHNNELKQQQRCDNFSGKCSSQTNASQISSSSIINDESNDDNSVVKQISKSMINLESSLENNDNRNSFKLIWKNVNFSYGCEQNNLLFNYFRKKRNLVLKDISGRIESNQLVAIIGPSGCGKTTLLHFLAGNKSAICKDKFKIVGLNEPKVSFIGQDDGLLPGLTAKETLIYASKLQNPKKNFNHEEHIKPIMCALRLTDCANRMVTKLSGGQAKRVTIAQELLYPTNLLILDEVTSGLDASTSYSIVKLLKQLVSDRDHPMTIVMSIHQPSARLFSVFDKVYLMSDGFCLYEGSCQINLINDYLKKFSLECPPYHNIADYLIEIASETEIIDNNSTRITIDNSIKDIKAQMVNYQNKNSLLIEDLTISGGQKPTILAKYDNTNNNLSTILNNDQHDNSKEVSMLINNNNAQCLYDSIERSRLKRQRPLLEHLSIHLNRSLLRIRRSYILTYLQLMTYILLGLQLSTFYGSDIGTLGGCPQLPMSLLSFVLNHDTGDDNINLEMRRIQENMNFLLVAIMTATFAALEITVITFPLEAKTVKREWRNGWYRVSSYFMGRTLADLPFQLSFVIIFCLLIYTMTGQIGLTTWRFGSFVLIIVMIALIAQSVGFIFGAIFMDNLPAAVFTAPLIIFPTLLFSGFFSRVSQIPTFYKPLTYLSHFRYAFDALLVTLYGYNRCDCDQETLDSYHVSFKNQTVTIKEMFSALFGTNIECNKGSEQPNDMENSIEDTLPTTNSEFIKNIIANHTVPVLTTTPMSLLSTSPIHIRTLEDTLVDTVFEHMNSTSTTAIPGDNNSGLINPSDILVHKFSSKITTILNTRSNFGHPIPTDCRNFNPYLMSEFDLHNNDLMFGLAMLFVFVVVSRLICNAILSFTIASRAT